MCQLVQCTVCSVVSVSARHSLSHETSSGFIRAPETNSSLYFREARFDVAASAQNNQQFCDFMRIREYAENGKRTTDLRNVELVWRRVGLLMKGGVYFTFL